MPFGSFGEAAAGDTIKGPYSDYDAALTALRADAAAADGDVYQLDNGLIYLANLSGPKILMPPDLHSQGWTHHTNASGSAYLTSSDALADVSGRGWDVTDNETGATVTKTAGSALVMTGGTGNNFARLKFDPTTNTQDTILLVIKATSTTTTFKATNGYLQSGTFWMNFALANGSADHAVWYKGSSVSGEGVADFGGGFVALLLRKGDADATSEIFSLEGAMTASASRATVDRATINQTGATTNLAFFVGSSAVLNITEAHLMVPS